ncbi:MAG TPA: hypothetical protein VFE72_12105 [Lysobacter sp.]|nr:hypothetical protein [Lysobacter sp.]
MTLAKRKTATKAEAAYQERARALGCVVCRFRIENGLQDAKWGQCGSTHLHHRNLGDYHGQRQLGQHAVVALGAWHHDGRLEIEWPPLSSEEMREVYGPSFKHAADFREWTADVLPGMGRGTEAWQAYQDLLLGANDESV